MVRFNGPGIRNSAAGDLELMWICRGGANASGANGPRIFGYTLVYFLAVHVRRIKGRGYPPYQAAVTAINQTPIRVVKF